MATSDKTSSLALSADEKFALSELTAKNLGDIDEAGGRALASLPDTYTSGAPNVLDSEEYNVTINFT